VFLFLLGTLLAAASSAQLPPIPGADQLGVGVDVVSGDFKLQSLFDLSYAAGKTWSNPFHAALVYSVPDQVQVVARTSSGSTANLYTTSTEYANKLSRGAGLDAGFGAVFSASAEVSHAKTFLSSGDAVLSVTEETVKLNSLSLLPAPLLKISDSLANAIAMHLPLQYNERAYATFVSYFGSHYITAAEYGGKATMMSSIKRDYLGTNSALVANANARVHFQQLKGGDVGASFSHRSSSDDYQQACSNSWSIEMVGGNAHLNMSQWADWTDSVKLAPAQISFRVVPLDRLMPDAARAANFRTYLQTYYAQNNKTDAPAPLPPLRLTQCQCTSFPYDGKPPSPDHVLVGLEMPSGTHVGGTRQACVPCYTLQGKFGSSSGKVSAKAPPQRTRSDMALLAESERRIAAARKRQTPAPANSTCGALPCLPGLDTIGIGFDALLGEMRDLRAVALTFTKQNTWSNPFYPKLVYNYADQVRVVTTTSNNKYSTTFNDTAQYAEDLANKAGLQATAGAYGGSVDVDQSRHQLAGSQAVLNVLAQDITLYEIDLAAYSAPSKTLSAMEALLPLGYQPDAYAAFVSHFGTHFIGEASFGGTARQRTTIDQHFFTNKAQAAVAVGVNGQYDMFKAGVRANQSSSDAMRAFANNSLAEITLLGGNYERLKVNDWDAWQESTKQAPAQVAVKLHPIHELFKDATKAANMKQHIDAYLSTGIKAFPRVVASSQHPVAVNEVSQPNGLGCPALGWTYYLTDYGMNVPLLKTALSPAICRSVQWSPAPRGAISANQNLYTCDSYWTNSSMCAPDFFMQDATYEVNLRGSWKTPILCSGLCWNA
jgi:hypothetical protein